MVMVLMLFYDGCWVVIKIMCCSQIKSGQIKNNEYG